MKFIVLACLSVFALAAGEKAEEKVAQFSLADIPEKVVKVHNFFKPHLEETHKCLKKNAKELAIKAKPHIEKACKDWKDNKKSNSAQIDKFHKDFKAKVGKSLKKLKGKKGIKFQITHRGEQIPKKTSEPTKQVKAQIADVAAC